MDFSARKALLLDGIDTVLKGLATIPQDAATTALIVDAQHLRREVEAWTSAPSDDEIARAEQRVLSLHVSVGALKR